MASVNVRSVFADQFLACPPRATDRARFPHNDNFAPVGAATDESRCLRR